MGPRVAPAGVDPVTLRLAEVVDRMPYSTAEREALESARDELAFRFVTRPFNPVPFSAFVIAGTVGAAELCLAVLSTVDPDNAILQRILLLGGTLALFGVFAFIPLATRARARHAQRLREARYAAV